MKPTMMSNSRLVMLMACASPGSAMAYHQGNAVAESNMTHRVSDAGVAANRLPGGGTAETHSAGQAAGWLVRLWQRFEQWSWEREVREREAYLAQSQNLSDLEVRMRRLEDAAWSRHRGTH